MVSQFICEVCKKPGVHLRDGDMGPQYWCATCGTINGRAVNPAYEGPCPICKKPTINTTAGQWCEDHGYASAEFARRGSKGGKARAAKLSSSRRKEIARDAANKRWSNPVTDKEDKLILSVRLSSGKFQSELAVPLDAAETFAGSVSSLINAAIAAGRSSREAPVTKELILKALHSLQFNLSDLDEKDTEELAFQLFQKLEELSVTNQDKRG